MSTTNLSSLTGNANIATRLAQLSRSNFRPKTKRPKISETIAHDGYPNLNPEELSQVGIKPIGWLTDLISLHIYIASKSFNGIVLIRDHEDVSDLLALQDIGCKFITLVDRVIQVFGTASFNDIQPDWNPLPGVIYVRKMYFNGRLVDATKVSYKGTSTDQQFHVFQSLSSEKTYSIKADGYDSSMTKSNNNIYYEQYLLIN